MFKSNQVEGSVASCHPVQRLKVTLQRGNKRVQQHYPEAGDSIHLG